MGEVDDAHHAEDDGQPGGQQHQPRDGAQHFDDDDQDIIHPWPPTLLQDVVEKGQDARAAGDHGALPQGVRISSG